MIHNNVEVLLVLVVAIIIIGSPFISNKTSLPISCVEISLGAIAVYFGLINPEIETFKLMADIGFLYLMFLAGNEVNVKKLLNIDPIILKTSFMYVALLYVIAIAIVYIKPDIHYLAIIILPLISIGLLASLSKEYGTNQPWLKISFISGTIGEVISIIAITIWGMYVKHGDGGAFHKSLLTLALICFMIVFFFQFFRVVLWWFPKIATKIMPYIDNKDQDLRFAIGIFAIVVCITHLIGLKPALGAFLAGMLIPTFFEHKKDLTEKLSSYGFGILVPIFFVYIGSIFDLAYLANKEVIKKAFEIVLYMALVKIVASMVFLRYVGLKNTILHALSHSMPLTLLIAVGTIAYETNIINLNEFYTIIVASILEAFIVMMLIKIIHSMKGAKANKTKLDLDSIDFH